MKGLNLLQYWKINNNNNPFKAQFEAQGVRDIGEVANIISSLPN